MSLKWHANFKYIGYNLIRVNWGQTMTIYDFLWARWVILSNVRTDYDDLILSLVRISYELEQIINQQSFWVHLGSHNYTLSFILIYMSSNLIRTIWVKYDKKSIFFLDHIGPLHKIQGFGAPKCQLMQTSSQRETYVQQGKTIEHLFLIYGLKCNTNIYIWLFEGPWGHSIIWLCLIHIYVHVK